MNGKTKRQKLLIGAATLAICGTLALGIMNEAPLILYPITPSLPPGLYVRTFVPPKVGTIAAFRVPKAAKRYKASIGETVHPDFLFMKPIVAEPGDLAVGFSCLLPIWRSAFHQRRDGRACLHSRRPSPRAASLERVS